MCICRKPSRSGFLAAQRAEESGAEGKPKAAGKKRSRTVVDVHVLSETAARRLSEAKPRPAVNGQDLAFEGGSFRVRKFEAPMRLCTPVMCMCCLSQLRTWAVFGTRRLGYVMLRSAVGVQVGVVEGGMFWLVASVFAGPMSHAQAGCVP